MDYRIDLTHAIGQIYFNEEGDADWHLEYHFHGPDRRYNTQYEMMYVIISLVSLAILIWLIS